MNNKPRASISNMQMLSVYATRDEITRLSILLDFAGFEQVERKSDPMRPSMQVALYDLKVRRPFEKIQL